jgi:hypothetical protein
MGATFDRTVTLGRQDLLLTSNQIQTVCAKFGIAIGGQEAERLALGKDRFCEPMFEKLGAASVDSIDAAPFEGANIIHDLNQPMPPEMHGSYDLVFDGGTLEHVFDFPTAISGTLGLPRLGGHYIMASPANNQMGHGFYQFSPDLFYRVFSEENGYKLKALFLAPTYADGGWFSIKDPATVGERIGHNASSQEMSIFAIAQRTQLLEPFSRPPQQSDYRAEWSSRSLTNATENRLAFFDAAMAARVPTGIGKLKDLVRGLVPQHALQWWRAVQQARQLQQQPNPAHFEPFPMP